MNFTRKFLLSPLVLAACLATDALGAQRVFVRSNGADSGGCTLNAPCRSFAFAMTQVDPSGEVVALDAAGYGVVTIDKSVTITANPGFFAGISASTGSAITVNGANIDVVLRSLNVNGLGATTGINVMAVRSLTVENCVVSNFSGNGIQVNTTGDIRLLDSIVRGNSDNGILIGGGAIATVTNMRMSNNLGSGLRVQDVTNFTTHVNVTGSDSSGNFAGFYAFQTQTGFIRMSIRNSSASFNSNAGVYSGALPNIFVAVGSSSIIGNAVGFSNSGANLETYGDNVLRYNGTATAGVISLVEGQ